MKDTETTVQRKVVFLTESGHPPTNEVAEAYLNLFAGEILKDLHGTKNAITQNATAGPYWNSPKNLIPIIQTNPKELYLAIFIDGTTCQLIGKEYFDRIVHIAERATGKTSWQIAMQSLGYED